MAEDKISVGDYIIIQRQKYTKLHKYGHADSTAVLGKDVIELRNINGLPYSTTFRMVASGTQKGGRNAKKSMSLEPCTEMGQLTADVLRDRESGLDNRNMRDDGASQNLGPAEIAALRAEFRSSSEIVTQIVENSSSFALKTEYSQEKYLKKKEKKYFEFVQIRRPNIRLISDVMYRQCSEKVFGLRMDSLSQLVSYSGICGFGNHLLYESGTNGLLPAVLLNSIGSNTSAQLVHMHPGNVPQRQALLALNLPKEQLDRCISVNIYSILRQFYQKSDDDVSVAVLSTSGTKRKIEDDEGCDPPAKILKNEVEGVEAETVPTEPIETDDCSVAPETVENTPPPKKLTGQHQWMIENERACTLLTEKLDSLVVCAKEHPTNIVRSLLAFVKPSRPLVVFSLSREILMELYVDLKSTADVTNLRITSNWLRMYQVLPNRTHPDVNMGGNSGFLLTGYTVG